MYNGSYDFNNYFQYSLGIESFDNTLYLLNICKFVEIQLITVNSSIYTT